MENSEVQKKKRPVLVWVFSIYFFLTVGFWLLTYFLVYVGIQPMTRAVYEYFGNFTALDYSVFILIGLAQFTGAVALFLLRKIALPIFVTELVVISFYTVWYQDTTIAISKQGLMEIYIGYGLLIAVCIYSWKLKEEGILT